MIVHRDVGAWGYSDMTANRRVNRFTFFLAGLMLAAVLVPASAGAIEVKKKLGGGGGGAASGAGPSGPAPRNPLTPALQQKLAELVASESDTYLSQESEKKADGKEYVDLEGAKFIYLPRMKDGKVQVQAKLEAAEYKGKKGDPDHKGTATGKRKALIFNYRLDGDHWSEVDSPKWEDIAEKDGAKKK
jgi:hypothetical protein